MIHQKANPGNDILCNIIQAGNTTKEQKIALLCQIIQNEAEKPAEDADLQLMEECSAYLDELSGNEPAFSTEELEQGLEGIRQPVHAPKKMLPKKRIRKLAVAIAATFLISVMTLAVTAQVQGDGSAWNFIMQHIVQIIKMNPGERLEADGVTLIKGESSTQYQSLEELLEQEGVDILYPSQLPEGIHVKQVIYNMLGENGTSIAFQFNDADLFMDASTARLYTPESFAQAECYQAPNMKCYIFSMASGEYQAVGYYGKYEYHILCNKYEALLTILNGLKGIERK